MRRLLIANRGEIALRVIRTARRLGIESVAVYSDADAGALHVQEATLAHALGGNASAESYLRIDKLIAAARATGADAVHPGYGFLSENADFAQAVVDAGLVWVGPPAAAIRALGSKSSAKAIAQARGVPCLPGYFGADQSDECFVREAGRIGYPVMVKAAAGGGGRGMRLVTEAAQLAAALRSARSEAQSSFGSGELLLERALLAPRHVEVQVFADAHGHCIHLGERDCSVQRRHQKLVEESPSPAVDAAMRERMGRCAVDLAQAAGYVGAGTVEFLVDGAEFFLMEMNTRLQVEHPVTEAVTGLDLVEWQLRVAQGEPLPLTQEEVTFSGHAIEVRLCAEDENFAPHTGTVQEFHPPPPGEGGGGGAARLRFDHALFKGVEVPPHYDSLLGKLIAHAPTREEAIARLAAALDRTQLLGVPTNRRLLAACLRHPEFRAGRALIPFLQQHGDELRRQLQDEEAALLQGACAAALAPPAPALACPYARPLRMRHRGAIVDIAAGQATHTARVLKAPLGPSRWHLQAGTVDLIVEDASFEPAARGGGHNPSDELRAPFNGKVIEVKARPGASVARGDTLLVIESMKLEHALAAARDAVVKSIHVAPGQQAATSQVLVTFEAA
ncbi:acetyl/propionyl/methylcrotonyl-CoA carboxylase subunit alpha [Ramlibacter tataouinensis]|uniref:Carbamoyl-phosphate synthase large subunit n=1 Tax=Ramlibacter tataouinensis TaxID=94132 RepID=A0A127JZT4_9BURK|nr:biotin carboxylase N-terminal domain-containing protein [Ramlibacter tataouinensis]AMO25467.1 carbamoyl-phosphate synthase large subunit [Ramlibacter tataouinensis]